MEVHMKLFPSSLTIQTILAGALMLGLVACPAAPDLTPETFTIPPVTGAALGVEVPSAAFTVTGINAPVPISVIGGKYQIDSAAFTSSAGTVSAGQTIKVSLLSSSAFDTTKTVSITVGSITAQFGVTTRQADTTPDAFGFAPVNNVEPNALLTSAATITGIDSSAITITGGQYSINGGTFTNQAGTINNNQTVTVSLIASQNFSTAASATLTIGGVSATYTITTRAKDETPDNFSFTNLTNLAISTDTTSNVVVLSGFDNAPISVVGGSYKINNGAFTTQAGTISKNDTLTLSIKSASVPLTNKDMLVTVGTVARAWDTKTNNLLPVQPVETLPIQIADGTGTAVNATKVFGPASVVRFNVPDTVGLKLDKIKVRVKVTHKFRVDMQILLFAPNNLSMQLFDTTALNENSNIDVTFDAASANPFVSTCITGGCTGLVQPLAAFTNLNILNQDPKGQWRIEIRDGFEGEVGTIEILSLELTMKL
jgi:subtilisin-like proprotein convertase family protein